MTNPFTSNKKVFITYALMWAFIFITQISLVLYSQKLNLIPTIIDSAVFNISYLILGIGIWYTVRFNSLETYNAIRLFTNHIVAAVITSGIWVSVGTFLCSKLFSDDKNYTKFLENGALWRFLIGILIYVVLVSIDYLIIYYNNFQEKVLKESELNSLVKEAELSALKYQINPHFIFNSLNSISSLTMSNPQRAQEMTVKLSAFLRGTLAKNDKQKSRLEDEINAGKLYLEIEKVRFADKFDYIEEVDKECKDFEVPNMILQPLFENAIKHGVYESLEKVTIKLSCKKEDRYFKIMVENGFDPESVSKKGAGIGIKNIQNRMKLIYGHDNLVVVEKQKDLFKVTIYIPLSVK